MDKRALRPFVFDALRKTPQTHFRAVENDIRRAAETYERRDVLALNEVLWDLLRQGILAPGKNSLNPDLPFVHITAYGARCLETGEILAHDPDRYVERLQAHTNGRATPTVVESAREALLSLLDGRHAAAAVLLAHAGESVLGELTEALIVSGHQAGRGTKRLEARGPSAAERATTALRALVRRNPPTEIADEAEAQLGGLGSLARLIRSRTGAPRIPSVDRDRTLAHVLLFPDQCRFVYHAIDWLEGKPDS